MLWAMIKLFLSAIVLRKSLALSGISVPKAPDLRLWLHVQLLAPMPWLAEPLRSLFSAASMLVDALPDALDIRVSIHWTCGGVAQIVHG